MYDTRSFSYDNLEWDKILISLEGYCLSDIGKKVLSDLSPLDSAEEINDHLDYNIEMQRVVSIGHAFSFNVSDLSLYFKTLKTMGSVLQPMEVNEIVKNLEAAVELRKNFEESEESFPKVTKLVKQLSSHSKLIKSFRKKIDEDGNILDGASPELKKIRREIARTQTKMKNRIEELVKQHGEKKHLQEQHYTIRNGRYVLPVKDSSKRHVNGITHQISATGATVFIEPGEIVEQNNNISRLKSNEQDEIRRILSDITAQLSEISHEIEDDHAVFSKLDYHYSCGKLAARLDANKPYVGNDKKLSLNFARHPLLLLKVDNKADVIPISIELGGDIKTIVLSGPNAGGKTVSLKCIGLLCLMIRHGIPIPASAESSVPVFNRILAEIGDSQSIDDDLSTFSARLYHIKEITDNITDNDLILIDEIGSGTDPQEGAGLGSAIMDFLTEHNASTVVTTHHGALKIYANRTEHIENASLSFDNKTLKPTYRLVSGVPGSSYALELSKKIGLPEKIIKSTESYLGDKQIKLEDFIRELESKISFYEAKNSEISDKEDELENLIEKYSTTEKAMKKEFDKKLGDEIARSEDDISQFNKKFEKLVKELRETKAAPEVIKKTKEVVSQEKERIKKKKKKHEGISNKLKDEKPAEINVGDTVRIKEQTQIGKVLSISRNKKKMVVQFNSMKIELEKNRLELTKEPKKKKLVMDHIPSSIVGMELDMRGMDTDDAILALDMYLVDAESAGYETVRLIHGKGTGVLRNMVQDYLRRDKRAKEFRLGAWGEGDTGVTIVRLI